MAYRYHASALSKDVSYPLGCIAGCRNIAAVKQKIEESGVPDPELQDAVCQLTIYFQQLVAGLGEDGIKLARRQELDGELLNGADADALDRAAARKVRTTINKTTAKRLAKLIGERARFWKD